MTSTPLLRYLMIMNMASSDVEPPTSENLWHAQLDAIETSDRHILLQSVATSILLAATVFVEASSMLAMWSSIPLAAQSAASAMPAVAGAVALICACYIALTLQRRRRDVLRNDIKDVRLQIAHHAAWEHARFADAAERSIDR